MTQLGLLCCDLGVTKWLWCVDCSHVAKWPWDEMTDIHVNRFERLSLISWERQEPYRFGLDHLLLLTVWCSLANKIITHLLLKWVRGRVPLNVATLYALTKWRMSKIYGCNTTQNLLEDLYFQWQSIWNTRIKILFESRMNFSPIVGWSESFSVTTVENLYKNWFSVCQCHF